MVHQLLKWLGLEGKYTNADDQKVADDYLDLNKFNLKTGFHLRSVKAKAKLHGWMREHNFEFAELRRAGWYFKANKLSFDIPSLWRTCVVRGCYIVMGTLFIAFSQFVETADYALLRVNATGTWFWAGNNEAYSPTFNFPHILRGNIWRLHQADCRYTDDPNVALDIWDKDVICNLVLGLNDEFIAESIDTQVKSAMTLKIGGVVCFGLFLLSALWLQRAKELNAQLLAESSSRDAEATVELHPGPPPISVTEPMAATEGRDRGGLSEVSTTDATTAPNLAHT